MGSVQDDAENITLLLRETVDQLLQRQRYCGEILNSLKTPNGSLKVSVITIKPCHSAHGKRTKVRFFSQPPSPAACLQIRTRKAIQELTANQPSASCDR
jgi:hypothetical protein